MDLQVIDVRILPGKTFPTLRTQKGFLARVNFEVPGQVTFLHEIQAALRAHVRPLPRVVPQMSGEVAFVQERFPALRAAVVPRPRVMDGMSREMRFRGKLFPHSKHGWGGAPP